MQVLVLYAMVVLIWGSTWAAIPYQLGVVAEELSVAYRFGLGSLILFVYAAISGRQLHIPRNIYPFVMIMGAMMFSAGYLFIYYGAAHITSGLVAVVFSLIVVSNAFYERIFFATRIESRMLLATALGVAGMALMFWPEVSAFSFQDETITGILLILTSVFLGSFGTMAAIVCTRQQLPVVTVNAHAMAWGALTSFTVAMILGRPINFSFAPSYLISLAYLSVFGSAIAFGCFLALLRLIGSARAAYTSVLFPIVALLISTLFEDYRWSIPAFAGIALIISGNWLALTKTGKKHE
jgi:drug/metabolite transporter (DMT)-like permease